MISVLEKKKIIIEHRLEEYKLKLELTERQEEKMYELQNELDEMQDSIDNLEEILSVLENLSSVTMSFY